VDWLTAEYRDLYDVPRAILCSNARGNFYFLSRFDESADAYADHYEVYRMPPMREGETCASWFGLETRAVERLHDLPVKDFPFDVATREFLPYDPIAQLVGT
jgi:hypothetical protein